MSDQAAVNARDTRDYLWHSLYVLREKAKGDWLINPASEEFRTAFAASENWLSLLENWLSLLEGDEATVEKVWLCRNKAEIIVGSAARCRIQRIDPHNIDRRWTSDKHFDHCGYFTLLPAAITEGDAGSCLHIPPMCVWDELTVDRLTDAAYASRLLTVNIPDNTMRAVTALDVVEKVIAAITEGRT